MATQKPTDKEPSITGDGEEAPSGQDRRGPPRERRDGRHQHHAAHRRDAGAADHLHGRDPARAARARHRAAAAAAAQPARAADAAQPGGAGARRAAPITRQQEPRRRSRTSRRGCKDIFQARSDKTIFVRAIGHGALRQGRPGDGPRQGRRRRADRHHLRQDDRGSRRHGRRPTLPGGSGGETPPEEPVPKVR